MHSTKKLLSTWQAAELCSVTPDTVLKWIKSGKIPASRTPGGHFRLDPYKLPISTPSEEIQTQIQKPKMPFQYCWEFKSKAGNLQEGCLGCVIYRSRTKRCYELSHLPEEAGHAKLYCSATCDDCDYYSIVKGQRVNVLVVSDRSSLRAILEGEIKKVNYNLTFTNCEYHCSMVVESYRPDYVVLDCKLGVQRSREFARNIAQDPRIPFVRIILAGEIYEFPEECDHEVFAFIKQTFTAFELEKLIDNIK